MFECFIWLQILKIQLKSIQVFTFDFPISNVSILNRSVRFDSVVVVFEQKFLCIVFFYFIYQFAVIESCETR